MTTFQDGPAKGTTLMLGRAPAFLRVVVNAKGVVDALDQPDDSPREGETLFAYELTAVPGWCHVRKKGGGGFYALGDYRMVPEQPLQDEMRTIPRWHEWVDRNKGRVQHIADEATKQAKERP